MAIEENENDDLMDDIEFIEDNELEDSLDLNDDESKTKEKKDITSVDSEEAETIDLDIEEEDDKPDPDPDKEKDTSKSAKSASQSSSEDSTNTLIPFANALKEEGILSDLDFLTNEEGEDVEITGELLVEAVRKEIKKNEYADLDEDAKNILDIVRAGGDVSAYLTNYNERQQSAENFSTITEENAEEFTRKLLKLEGLSDARIDEMIDDRTINNTLVSRAQKDLPTYKKLLDDNAKASIQAAKAKEEADEQAYEQSLNNFKEHIESQDEIIKGQKLNKSVREKIYNLATQPVGVDKQGNPVTAFQKTYSEKPLETETVINYLYLLTDGFTKLEKLSSSTNSTSTALRELNNKLDQEKNNVAGIKSGTQNNNNNNKPDILSAIDKMF